MPKASYISTSQDDDWQCPAKWALLRVERKRPAPVWAFVHGGGIHDAFENAGRDKLEGSAEPSDPKYYFEALVAMYRSSVQARLAADDPEGLLDRSLIARGDEDAQAIIEAFVSKILPHYHPISCEETLGDDPKLPVPGSDHWFFTGRIDARVRLRDGYAAVDFKTGQPWEVGAERGKAQATAYLWAERERWHKLTPEQKAESRPPASTVLFLLFPVVDGVCVPERRPTRRTEADLFAYGEHLRYVVEAIDDAKRSGVFPPNVSSACARCSVLGHCRAGKEYVGKKRLNVVTPGVTL